MAESIVKIAQALKSGKRVDVVTPSDRPELSSNGGHYAYATKYIPVPTGVEITYWNSSDFEYCRNCGRFDRNCYCKAEVVSVAEAAKRIVHHSDDEYVEVK